MIDIGIYGSPTSKNMRRATIVDATGTFFLVLIGTSLAVEATLRLPIAGASADSLTVALAFGFTLLLLVFRIGDKSGCHLNPAVTLGLAVGGGFPWKYVPGYVVGQIAGATGASFVVRYIFGKPALTKALLGAAHPAMSFSPRSVFVVEFIGAFILQSTICKVVDDKIAPEKAAIYVGLALTVAILFAGPVSGGAINPARALGPMIVSGKYTDFLEYIFGPISGALFAAWLNFKHLPKVVEPSEAEEQKEEEPN
jgi:MIP family channel proteins